MPRSLASPAREAPADRGRPAALRTLAGRPEVPPLVFLVAMAMAVSLFTPAFMTGPNLLGILEQVAVISIVALAVNQVILAGEIDVSTGSLLAVCAFVYGNLALALGGAWLPLLASLTVAAAVGLINGLLSTVGRVPSIIATLGMLFVLRGAVLLFGGAQVLNLPPESRIFGLGTVLGLPVSVAIALAVFVVMEALSRHSRWGRNVMAIGGNARAARELGLPITSVRIGAFVASGLACGLAAAVFLGQIGQLQATAATGFELKVIAAVVLGGTSIKGGYGSNAAPVIGAVLVGIILNALTLNRVPGTFELLVLGALILAAVSFDGVKRLLSGERRLA
jgi:ribose/xylose/arabinose/galactoside ABC-type transport system permease subunit